MRKVDNPEYKVISLIVDADTEMCGCIACLDMCVEITHFSRRCGSVRNLQFWRVNCAYVITKVHIVNAELIVDVTKGVAELDGFCNVMFHCFDHEIVLEGMKEEISQQRCTIGAHWYTNVFQNGGQFSCSLFLQKMIIFRRSGNFFCLARMTKHLKNRKE